MECAELLACASPLALDHEEWTPLHAAAVMGKSRTLGLLLAVHAAVVIETDIEGSTPLHLATQHGFLECCDLLSWRTLGCIKELPSSVLLQCNCFHRAS